MAVLKSYKCEEHGYFDAWEQACEHCDKVPEQVFLKPFSIKSDRTKKADRTLKGLAKDFGKRWGFMFPLKSMLQAKL